MRLLPLLFLLLAPAALWAQTAEPAAPALEGRKNQKVERIVHEDAGSRIEETRYGGQTQNITVVPKADVPAYEIQSTDLARSRPADARDGMGTATGTRFWNILKF